MNTVSHDNRALNIDYVERITRVTYRAIHDHPRTLAVRIDLRFPDLVTDTPDCFARTDTAVITRFIKSLDAQIKADLLQRARSRRRVYDNNLRYCWAREYGGNSQKPHYHVVIFVNKDNYAHLGGYHTGERNLASKIQRAWCSALSVDFESFRSLIHFPHSPVYYLEVKNSNFKNVLASFMDRVVYLAKDYSKVKSPCARSFGCSMR